MKKIFMAIFFILIVLIAVVVIKTFIYPFKKIESDNISSRTVDTKVSEKAIQRFAGGVRIPTVSSEVYEDTHFKPFDDFKVYLQNEYPEIYKTMDTTTINKYGLLFHWKGKNPGLKPILFLSHYDVVPVIGYDPVAIDSSEIVYRPNDTPLPPIDSIQSKWTYHPFSGAVADGRIYGRGTLDMKVMLFSILEAADALIAEGFQPEQDIWFAFGQDEEVSGRQGAVKIADYFKEKNITFDAVYDEGGLIATPRSVLSSVNKPLALVGAGEKGFLTLRLTVYGLGGHSSMPPAKSSLVYTAEIIERLNKNQMPAHIIPPIESFLKNIGGKMDFMSRMGIANQWLLKPVLLNSFSKSPASNALIRTTTAISMASGSGAPNVLTSTSTVTVNFRILQGDSVAGVLNHVKELCKDYKVDIEVISAREPSNISPDDSKGFKKIEEIVSQIYPDAIVTSYITIGGTDAYKYQIVSDNVYRFMPLSLNLFEQRTVHNENEYITIENYGKTVWYFKELMQTY